MDHRPTYDLMACSPAYPDHWYTAARDCHWRLLLSMVRLWRRANPEVALQAIRHRR